MYTYIYIIFFPGCLAFKEKINMNNYDHRNLSISALAVPKYMYECYNIHLYTGYMHTEIMLLHTLLLFLQSN